MTQKKIQKTHQTKKTRMHKALFDVECNTGHKVVKLKTLEEKERLWKEDLKDFLRSGSHVNEVE